MISFQEFIAESEDHLQKAHTAMMAGDYQSALNHLKQHVPGKSRRRDAEVAKLQLALKTKLKKNE